MLMQKEMVYYVKNNLIICVNNLWNLTDLDAYDLYFLVVDG